MADSDNARTAESMPVQAEKVRVTPLTLEQVRSLSEGDRVLVPDHRVLDPEFLVPARIGKSGTYLTRENDPQVRILSDFGASYLVNADKVFEEDPLGEERFLMPVAGSRVSSSLFFPGLDPKDAEERLKRALVAEFGPGVVEVWNMKSAPTRDLRWDIYHVQRGWVPGKKTRRGTTGGSFEEIQRKLVARGIRDGQQSYFQNVNLEGDWIVVALPHEPHLVETEVL
jgi:hypothetical protein